MKYILIDLDGELYVKDGTYQQARTEVGTPGWDQVQLPRFPGHSQGWSGWVNDIGHQHPDRYPRNIIGGLVLTGIGAAMMPYAGPVVITGWHPGGMSIEVRGLNDLQVQEINETHADARAALAGKPGPLYDNARDVAEHMRAAPTPTVTILTGAEFLERLRGGS